MSGMQLLWAAARLLRGEPAAARLLVAALTAHKLLAADLPRKPMGPARLVAVTGAAERRRAPDGGADRCTDVGVVSGRAGSRSVAVCGVSRPVPRTGARRGLLRHGRRRGRPNVGQAARSVQMPAATSAGGTRRV